MSHNVGDFIEMLKYEDRGIDTIFVKNAEGVRIASKTSIQTLFDQVSNIHLSGLWIKEGFNPDPDTTFEKTI